ncbi:MAG: alanine racemase [Xanthomonadales bacterium]|nr:alanine racemase [Xanthomonadales bacterium]MDH4018589.1 alanine racemase [Xanthomonadales bacterium]
MRPTIATIRFGDIASNYQLACDFAPDSKSIAVIKANAYGHGMVELARILEPMVPVFAVAVMEEALQLRDAGIVKPILVLQGINQNSDAAEAVKSDFWLLLHNQQQVDRVIAATLSSPVRVWLKVDTGMHRLGFAPQALDRLCVDLHKSLNVQQELVLCTHLACADDRDNQMTREQVRVIRSCAAKYRLATSIANSAGIMYWPESHAEWNRPGYMLYGLCPTGSFTGDSNGLRPAMTMNSEVIAIRELKAGEGVGYGRDWVAKRASRIGTIAIGYGDGYPRHAPSGTPVLVNGERVPLTGRVSMDAISVDLTDLEKVEVGDPVELWGQNLSVNEVASFAGTIGYEILAGLTGRVPLNFRQ